MKKSWIIIILLVSSILISGCTQKDGVTGPNCNICKEKLSEECIHECPNTPDDLYSCSLDSDCTPIPTCQPTECINKKYENSFEKPISCLEIGVCGAAYNSKDCGCINNKCVNKNLNKTCR